MALSDDAVAAAIGVSSDAGTLLCDSQDPFAGAARIGGETAHPSPIARPAEHALVRVTEADDTGRVLRSVRAVSGADDAGESTSR